MCFLSTNEFLILLIIFKSYVADILIAINPNRTISDLYSDETRHAYEIEATKTPHIYAVGKYKFLLDIIKNVSEIFENIN